MKELRERCDSLLEEQRRWCDRNNCDDSSALAQHCLSERIETFAREIRNEALEEISKCLDREDDYYGHLDGRGETRDARYCTSVVRGYIAALKTDALAIDVSDQKEVDKD